MSWPLAILLLSICVGLFVLFSLGVRLFRQVKSLGHTVANASERVAAAQPPQTSWSAGPDSE